MLFAFLCLRFLTEHGLEIAIAERRSCFSGGLELLFGKQKHHEINLPEKGPLPLKKLLEWMKNSMIKERPELFLQGSALFVSSFLCRGLYLPESSSRRPGVLLMVNDTDWELLGRLEYQVQDGDSLVFISTLHGG